MVFLGSSRTTASVNDTLIEKTLNGALRHKPIKAINLGYCRFGQNLQYVFIKELLKHYIPKTVVLEIRKIPDQPAHMHFSYFADGEDLLSPTAFFHHNYIGDLADGLYNRLKNFKGPEDTLAYPTLSCGYEGIPYLLPFDTTDAQTFVNENNPSVNLNFLQKSLALLKKHQVKVLFLYLPQYGRYQSQPDHLNWYRQYGKVLLPPDTLTRTPCFWADRDHLNTEGANWFSQWLSEQLLYTEAER